jgi:hypothetical protein
MPSPRSECLGLDFDLPKFQLVQFVSPRCHRARYRLIPLVIGNIAIAASSSAKLLGSIRNHKLPFWSHVELTQKRGTEAVLTLSHISSPSFGLPHSCMWQLSLTVVVPRMEYALPVRYRPVSPNEDVRRAGTVWIAKALGKVQRHATQLITGALRTTATDALDLHTNLLPIHIRLNRSALNGGVCLASLPPANPVRQIVHRCHYVPRFHRSPIHHLIAAFPVLRRDFETDDPNALPARAPAGALAARIAPTEETATKEMEAVQHKGGEALRLHGWIRI